MVKKILLWMVVRNAYIYELFSLRVVDFKDLNSLVKRYYELLTLEIIDFMDLNSLVKRYYELLTLEIINVKDLNSLVKGMLLIINIRYY